MKAKKWLVALSASAALVTLVACGSKSGSTGSTGASSQALSGKITAGGSTALQPLIQEEAKTFMAKNPKVQLSVQGGGSGVGLTQAAAGTFQIGNSDIFAEEKAGIDASQLTDHKVAVVGFAAIVNKGVTADNLSVSQLTDIFTGKLTNWSQVGGKDQAITVIERTAGSGTRVNFDRFALGGAAEMTGAITTDSSSTVVTQVAQTPGAISYVAFSYIDTSKDIKALSLDHVKPTDAQVARNAYKIWGYEHMYTLTKKESAAERAFIKSVSADKPTLKKMGYIPVTDMAVDRASDGKVKQK